jgi:transposase
MGKNKVEIEHVVGIDISSDKFDVCIRHGESKAKNTFKTNLTGFRRFALWLERFKALKPQLWMEATGRYHEPVAEWAHEQGWQVVVANPRAVRHFAKSRMKKSKTDALDAEVLLGFAESADEKDIHFWHPRSESQKELRDRQLEIQGLKKMIGQEENRLKCGLSSKAVEERIRAHIEYMKLQIKELQAESEKLIKADPDMSQTAKRLRQIKGFGPITIALLLWKVDFQAFKKGRQLVKYAGLDPAAWESGKLKRRSQISREGHAELRSGLYMAAMVAIKHDPGTAEFVRHLKDRKAPNKVVICAVMARLLRLAFALVRDADKDMIAADNQLLAS